MVNVGSIPTQFLIKKTHTMYKFYKILSNGNEKYCASFHSTLDPEYHSYINWCKENDMRWKLIWTYDNSVKFQG
jgi:hypothetical protein